MKKEEITEIPSFEIKKEDNYFGKAIKAYRNDRNWSQKKLQDVLGIDPSTISLIENGKSLPRYCMFVKIAERLKVKQWAFFLLIFPKFNVRVSDSENIILQYEKEKFVFKKTQENLGKYQYFKLLIMLKWKTDYPIRVLRRLK